LLLALIATSGILIACQKDARNPDVTSAASGAPLTQCVNEFTTDQTLFECEDFTIKSTNVAGGITVTIQRTGPGENDHFTQVDFGVNNGALVRIPNDEGNRKFATFTIPTTSLTCGSNVALTLVVRGLGGLNLPSSPCQALFELDDDNSGRGKLTLNRTLVNECLCVTTGCSMSQGYFLSKPNVIWPASSNNAVTVGGQTYTKDQISAIFKLSCNSAGKLGLQQVATIYLSIANGNLSGVPTEIAGFVNTIETFLASKPKLTTTNACSSTFNSKTVQSAAGAIGNWIDANHCSE
jgi:hypothetical protein